MSPWYIVLIASATRHMLWQWLIFYEAEEMKCFFGVWKCFNFLKQIIQVVERAIATAREIFLKFIYLWFTYLFIFERKRKDRKSSEVPSRNIHTCNWINVHWSCCSHLFQENISRISGREEGGSWVKTSFAYFCCCYLTILSWRRCTAPSWLNCTFLLTLSRTVSGWV